MEEFHRKLCEESQKKTPDKIKEGTTNEIPEITVEGTLGKIQMDFRKWFCKKKNPQDPLKKVAAEKMLEEFQNKHLDESQKHLLE